LLLMNVAPLAGARSGFELRQGAMARARKPTNVNREKARRASLTDTFARREYLTTTPRKPAAGPTSPAAKLGDPILRALIDAALAKREGV
jgi:hypothetical protein